MSLAVRDERLKLRVGIGVMVLLTIATVATMLLDRCQLGRRTTIVVYFAHTPLTEGGDVQIAGRVVGEVSGVRLVPDSQAPPGHPLAEVGGGVALDVTLRGGYAGWAAVNGAFFVNSKGILGTPYLEIGPPDHGAMRERPVRAGDEIRGIDPPRVDRVMQRSYENLMASAVFLATVKPELDALRTELDRLGATLDTLGADGAGRDAADDAGEAIARLLDEARRLRDLGRAAGVGPGDLRRLSGEARATAGRLSASIEQLRARLDALRADLARVRGAIPDDLRARFTLASTRLSAALGKVSTTVARAEEILALVEGGEGTIGALLNDPEFADDTKQLGKYIKRHPWVLLGGPR